MDPPLLLPKYLNNSPRQPKSHSPRGRRLIYIFGTAVLAGTIFHLVLAGVGPIRAARHHVPTAVNDWLPSGNNSVDNSFTVVHEKTDCPLLPIISHPTGSRSKTPKQLIAEEEAPWSIDKIREMVSHTKGYYVRDWSLGLGWNNVCACFFLVLRS
jgi:hypothetical protein